MGIPAFFHELDRLTQLTEKSRLFWPKKSFNYDFDYDRCEDYFNY